MKTQGNRSRGHASFHVSQQPRPHSVANKLTKAATGVWDEIERIGCAARVRVVAIKLGSLLKRDGRLCLEGYHIPVQPHTGRDSVKQPTT